MTWSPGQYAKFEDERTRPARDLLAQVPLDAVTRAVDLGCGPGNSTALLVERFGATHVAGLDSDPAMLEAARARLPSTPFVAADVATWQPSEPVDLLFANAVFQWVPDHLAVFDRLMTGLAPGGVLAVQMPDNLAEPSHVAMEETASAGPWRTTFARHPVRRVELPSPATYYDRLAPHASRIDVWHTIYNHPLANAAAIVEWFRGSALQRYLEVLEPGERDAFAADYLARVTAAYPPLADGRVLLRFPRLFVVAVRR